MSAAVTGRAAGPARTPDGAGAAARLRSVGAALALAVVAVGLGVVAGEGAADAVEPRVPGVGPQGGEPQFTVECDWSHRGPHDPIVHPGHPGRSHLHDFFGATTTGADSTPETLRASPTTCANQADTAAYWAPALLAGGEAVDVMRSVAYYRVPPGADAAAIEPFPADLEVIAGDPVARSPQPVGVAAWRCGVSPVLQSEPPECPRTAPLGVRVAFPDCWDGRRLSAEDHRSHLAYGTSAGCPTTHPVPVPQLVFTVTYRWWGPVEGLELASGGVHSLHADFVNAWDQGALEREVRACLNREKVCGVVSSRATG